MSRLVKTRVPSKYGSGLDDDGESIILRVRQGGSDNMVTLDACVLARNVKPEEITPVKVFLLELFQLVPPPNDEQDRHLFHNDR